MNIEWVNHASFIVRESDVALICDPWLLGSAFNDGWDLLCETKLKPQDLTDITHMWFSHEHPDHFSPGVLKQIPKELREKITVIYQYTADKKVLNFCKGLGFKILELEDGKTYELGKNFSVVCGKVPFYDSWLLMSVAGLKLLNLNDCVVDGDAVASAIAKRTGDVDVLFTQFSYANWIGNPEDKKLREESAAEKLERMKMQEEAFNPKITIPFASFVYFSHEENSYMNDSINTIRSAYSYIKKEFTSKPVVLFPGEKWTPLEAHDNEQSLSLYDNCYDLSQKKFRTSTPVSLEDLKKTGDKYIERMYANNSKFLIKLLSNPIIPFFPPVYIGLMDQSSAVVRVSLWDGVTLITENAPAADATMHSETLNFLFKFDWGFDTTLVNGRFRASDRGMKRLFRTLSLGPLNNTGRHLKLSLLCEVDLVKRVFQKLIGQPA